MELKFAVIVPHSELSNFLQEMFQTTLKPEEIGHFRYNREHVIQDGIAIKDPRRTFKESVAPPETISFILDISKDIARDIAIGTISGIVSTYIFSKLQKVTWLKIGDKTPKITLDDIRKVIQEELEKLKEHDSKKS